MTLPAGWFRLDPDPAALEAYLNSMNGARPEAKQLVQSAAAALKSGFIKFLAFDTRSLSASSFSDMNVLQQPTGGLTLDALLSASVSQLKAIFKTVEPVRSSIVGLSAGRAGKIVYGFKQPIPGAGSRTVHILQFVIMSGYTAYIVSFATTAALKTRDKVFTSIANTFELLP